MIQDAINRLKERVKSKPVKKSDGPTGEDAPDLQTLASQVTTLLDSGSVVPETDKVKEWAIAQGISEGEAASFADDVIDAYFDDNDGNEIAKSELTESEKKSKEGEAEKEEKDKKKKKSEEESEKEKEVEKARLEFISEIQNTLEVLKSGQETLAAAIEHLLDTAEDNSQLSKEVQTLKSEIGALANRPANEKTPVTSKIQKTNDPIKGGGLVTGKDRDHIGNLIIKGIEAGHCQLEDIAYFESTWKLSDRAQAFINEYKEVQK
ncbi:hypothetical protein [Leptospira adleri]|uniref:Uncharacterized protein n=1 Tax=Leptospira adleri TaxID=2023186 RepID=A0A2M9YJ09_9LEPT|nr:hypothetical protein [Leptospira adleri]PJZ51525.1 hypothetical protein CH380_19760 [Leptospira adleri]PJZ61567.1 hypothetical protein CH376_12325 [Leptospira adleri]